MVCGTLRLLGLSLSLAVASSFLVPSVRGADDDVSFEKDVEYLPAGRAEKADLYRPAKVAEGQKFPAVVIIHGGGWTGGDKGAKREDGIGRTLASHGYVGMSINYLLSNKEHPVVWPQNLHDCKTAVRWLRKNAEKLHIDPDHIGVIGGSAGGHLSTMVGVTGPEDGLDPKEPYGEFSCRVQAVIDLYGPAEVRRDHAMFGQTRAEAPDRYRQAEPLSHLDKNDPPVLIMHGTADKTVDVEQSRILAAAMKKAGVEHTLMILEGEPHTFGVVTKLNDLRPVVLGFFDRHLKPGAGSAPASSRDGAAK